MTEDEKKYQTQYGRAAFELIDLMHCACAAGKAHAQIECIQDAIAALDRIDEPIHTDRQIVKDEQVVNIWTCHQPDCSQNGEHVEIPPTFYQESGNPMCSGEVNQDDEYCECDRELSYVRTEIITEVCRNESDKG